MQPALQEQLQDQTDRLRNDLDERTQQIGDLRDQLAALNGFADSVMPYLTTGTLTGTPVVLVTQAGVEDEVLTQAQAALASAGARVLTTVSATDQLVSEDPTTQEELATIVGEPTAPAEELPRLAAESLAQGLSQSTTVIGGEVPGRHAVRGVPGTDRSRPLQAPSRRSGPGQVASCSPVDAGRKDASPRGVAVPLVERLAGLGVPVAAGESLLTDYPYVSLVRADGIGRHRAVDDLDQSMGGAARSCWARGPAHFRDRRRLRGKDARTAPAGP